LYLRIIPTDFSLYIIITETCTKSVKYPVNDRNPMIARADLHIHSHYSSSTSPKANLINYCEMARKKGLDLIGSGDCLHPGMLKELSKLSFRDGLFEYNRISIVLQCEVEDLNRAHHLIFFPSISEVEGFRDSVKNNTNDMQYEGRPTINLFGSELAELVHRHRGIIGPAHIFTPYTGMLPLYGSLENCYKNQLPRIEFIELGLSADTALANPIGQLSGLKFLSNSDAHSPSPRRMGREFNLIRLDKLNYDSMRSSLERTAVDDPEAPNRIIANYGLPPQEGRYHLTGCSACYEKFTWDDARKQRMRCQCGGRIKRGIRDICEQYRDLETEEMPQRPPYHYILPLPDIIGDVYEKSPDSSMVTDIYNEILLLCGNELSLFDTKESRELIREKYPSVALALDNLISGKFEASPGGGGEYGKIKLLSVQDRSMLSGKGAKDVGENRGEQKSLFEF